MKAKSGAVAIIVLFVIFGSVMITSYLGKWTTAGDRIPAQYTQGDAIGQADPADIRGSFSFGDIEAAFGIPAPELAAAFGMEEPANPAGIQVKEVEAVYSSAAAQDQEVGTNSVRVFVAMYKGLPIELTDTTYLPRPAVEMLKQKASLSPEQLRFLDQHTVDLP